MLITFQKAENGYVLSIDTDNENLKTVYSDLIDVFRQIIAIIGSGPECFIDEYFHDVKLKNKHSEAIISNNKKYPENMDEFIIEIVENGYIMTFPSNNTIRIYKQLSDLFNFITKNLEKTDFEVHIIKENIAECG